ncbi:hypothetical protein [Streptomyces sp. NPDC095602]|uniref:hypothetical protein n=1 Tax=Streptomyces sp. NPDC095602 TaxID=3155819 RepID=UPI003330D322
MRGRAGAAGVYVGLVALASVAYGAAGAPDGWGAPLTLAAFPGAVLVAFLGYYLLPALLGTGEADAADESTGALDFLPQYAGGAVVNVLLVWAAVAFVRHFAREARRSRERAGR